MDKTWNLKYFFLTWINSEFEQLKEIHSESVPSLQSTRFVYFFLSEPILRVSDTRLQHLNWRFYTRNAATLRSLQPKLKCCCPKIYIDYIVNIEHVVWLFEMMKINFNQTIDFFILFFDIYQKFDMKNILYCYFMLLLLLKYIILRLNHQQINNLFVFTRFVFVIYYVLKKSKGLYCSSSTAEYFDRVNNERWGKSRIEQLVDCRMIILRHA